MRAADNKYIFYCINYTINKAEIPQNPAAAIISLHKNRRELSVVRDDVARPARLPKGIPPTNKISSPMARNFEVSGILQSIPPTNIISSPMARNFEVSGIERAHSYGRDTK